MVIGVDYVVKSEPDGHTLVMMPNNLPIIPGLYPKVPYDTMRDLAPIAMVAAVRETSVLFGAAIAVVVLKEPLRGPSVNAADVIRATDFVLPALEIVDNRYNGRGKKMLVDSISDAAACGLVVLGGRPVRLTDIDIRRVSASLLINGDIMETGSAAAVMGNPINAVAWLANKLNEFGVGMEPGNVILSGSFIKAIPFEAGDSLVALYDQLGEVTLMVGD